MVVPGGGGVKLLGCAAITPVPACWLRNPTTLASVVLIGLVVGFCAFPALT